MRMRIKSAVIGTALCLASFTSSAARADTATIDTPSGCVCAGPSVAPSLQAGTHALSGYCNFTGQTGKDSDKVYIYAIEVNASGATVGGGVFRSVDAPVGRPPMQNRVRYSEQLTFPNPGVTNGVPNVQYYEIRATPYYGPLSNEAANETSQRGYVKITGY